MELLVVEAESAASAIWHEKAIHSALCTELCIQWRNPTHLGINFTRIRTSCRISSLQHISWKSGVTQTKPPLQLSTTV